MREGVELARRRHAGHIQLRVHSAQAHNTERMHEAVLVQLLIATRI